MLGAVLGCAFGIPSYVSGGTGVWQMIGGAVAGVIIALWLDRRSWKR